ncbi:MAG: nucleotidyltransferase [Turicibacter sp.]|nr:nucleotidyltransferase [Turicibacter sp.]
MKATGLIVEYNPFHNGHLYHLTQSMKQSQADVLIVVMSGHFTQRGEPTILNKWDRAKLALANGADLVIELPYAYSCQHAELFAKGAVSILTHLHVNELIFGSESGNIDELIQLEEITKAETFQKEVQKWVKTGLSLPKAHTKALETFNLQKELGSSPNNTLGLYYIRAIHDLNSPIKVGTVARIHSDYRDQVPTHHQITSATSIRNLREQKEDFSSFVPRNVLDLLEENYNQTNTYHTWETYFPFLKQKILTLTPTHLVHIHDMEEGLENRLYSTMISCSSFEEFINTVKTKRYTRTRLQRICANILTHTTKDWILHLSLTKGVPYIRILGATPTGKKYLKFIKKEVEVPIYSKFDSKAHTMLKHEQSVTAAYSSILPEPYCTNLNRAEFKNFPQHFER